jgi:hypothetical protein
VTIDTSGAGPSCSQPLLISARIGVGEPEVGLRPPPPDFEAAFNKARTKVKGTWATTMTFHDAAGAVTDTCESGTVNWTAKQ